MPRKKHFIGVDIGQSRDPTAICVVRKVISDDDTQPPIFEVPYLERLPLGVTYPGVISHARRLLNTPELLQAELICDVTGVGKAIHDMFIAAGLSSVIGVLITGQDSVVCEGLIYKVGKICLVSTVQALLHEGRLRVLKTASEAAVLRSELSDFRASVTDLGRWTFGARENRHDDLVLALAIALWRAQNSSALDGWVDYYRREVARSRGELPPLKPAPWPNMDSSSDTPPETEMVTLHAPPFRCFQPARAINYASNEAGLVTVAKEHVQAMLEMGCWRIREVV